MAMNPMQRKAHNSFLLGMLITLVVTGIIIAVLIFQLINVTNERKKEQENLKKVYVLTSDVNSGAEVTTAIMKLEEMNSKTIPANAMSQSELDAKANIVDEESGNLIRKIPVVAKINLKKGTIITSDMVATQDEIANDLRRQEYNMVILPSQLQTGEYVDIRLRLPNGTDFIVVSHKKIEIPTIDGVDSLNSIWLNMSETEILTMSNAIIEAYKVEGALLYANKYVEAGLQQAATPTYIPSDEVLNLINQDPNCVAEAKQALFQRNNDAKTKSAVRNPINDSLNQNADNANDNVISSVEDELKKSQEERQKYLESLGGNF